MATLTNSTSKSSKHHHNKQQTMLKQQQKQPQPTQANQYQVPYMGPCSPYSGYPPPPPLFHQAPYITSANPAATASHNYQQKHYGGAHTISRSKDLHKQYGHQKAAIMKNQALVYYDQPYLGYGGPGSQAPPGLFANGPHAAMSLAVRAPKERGPIPTSLVNGTGTIGPASSRHYLAAPIDLYQQQFNPHHKPANKFIYQDPLSLLDQHARLNKPLCRCRVMYLGSSVPHITKNGLHGIQEPLKHLYPEEKFSTNSMRKRSSHQNESLTIDISHLSSSLGIDSWLSVWSNGLLLENVDEFGREIKRFFSIESLHYCAAVRYFDTTTLMSERQLAETNASNENKLDDETRAQDDSLASSNNGDNQAKRGVVRFLPLDAPIFQYPGMLDANHPPLFASIMRRTTGIKVLECHAFICRRDAASNALVRCCTHAYADFLSAKRMSAEFGDAAAAATVNSSAHYNGASDEEQQQQQQQQKQARQSRAVSSSGRQNRMHSQSGLLNHDQYHQVVEALVQKRPDANNNTNQDHGSRTLTRRDVGRARRPARSLSTGGTNSQEMTHSDENSLEVDSEDNYAIILRQATNDKSFEQQQQHQHQNGNTMLRTNNTTNASTINRRAHGHHRERKSKGSSKSLFKGFMPHEQQPMMNSLNIEHQQQYQQQLQQQIQRANLKSRDEINRLSHSLDHLQVTPLASYRLGPASKCSNINTSYSNTDDSDIKYSIVAGKQKRHSKSMQQLVQVPATGHHHHETTMVNRDSSANLAWISTRHRRKAASCQDIMAVQQQQHGGGSLSRGSSCSGRRRSRSKRSQSISRQSSMSSLHHNSLVGSQTKLNSSQRWSKSHQAPDTNNCIYATCDEPQTMIQPIDETSLRILRSDYCMQPAASETTTKHPSDSHVSSSSSSVKNKKSSKRRSSDHRHKVEQEHQLFVQQQQQQQQQMLNPVADPLGYYQFLQPPPPPPLSRADCYSPNGLMFGPNNQPIYGLPQMPGPQLTGPGAYYLSPQHRQMYETQSYLPPTNSIYLGPSPAPQQALNGHQYHHPMFQPATITARHLTSPLYNGAPASMIALNGTMNGISSHMSSISDAARRDSKLAKKSQTLATRFRCLSPPLNFLAGGNRSSTGRDHRDSIASAQNNGALINHDQNNQQQQQQQLADHRDSSQLDQNNNNRQSLASNNSTTSSGGERISPSDIVSGQPGFLATNGAGREATTIVSSVQKRDSRQKMSWIKRLSLTLSSGSSSVPRQQPSGSVPQQNNVKNRSSKSNSTKGEIYRDFSETSPLKNQSESVEGAQTESSQECSDPTALADQISDPRAANGKPDHISIEPQSEQQQIQPTTNKRKKAGLFSGSLTLGRKSRGKSK